MTSEKKIAANRENARKSTGPRTTRGRSRASVNALRHGLDAAYLGDQELSGQVERLAKAICRDSSDPFRFEQAIIIAESQIMIARVHAARIAAIQRTSKPTCNELALPGSITPQELEQIDRDLGEGNTRSAIQTIKRKTRETIAFTKALLAAMTAKNEHDRIEARREADRMIAPRADETTIPHERDEVECFVRRLPELLSLERYERRALSRRKRALRRFDALAE
jgi:hypothetical protein